MNRPGAPFLSIIMPVYNGGRFLRRSVASVLGQSFADWELITVDDASTDESWSLIGEFAAADPRIRVFRHPANRGQAAARNTALSHTRGTHVVYLDQDDEFYPGHFARLHEWRDKPGVLVFRYDQIDELAGSRSPGRITEYDPAARRQAMFTETVMVPLGVAHRRDLLDRVGLFDEKLGKYRGQDEDGDLWRRFAKAGEPFTFVPHKCGLYHVRSDSFARVRPDPPREISGFPSPVMTVDLRDGEERHAVQIPRDESGTVAQLFEQREYGGLPPGSLKDPPVILDIGAHVGTFALYAKLALNRRAVVHCFEPYPPAVALLRKNLIRFPDVTVHPFGLGLRDEHASLLLDPGVAVANSLRTDLVPNPAGRATVSVRHAGAVWDELGLGEVDILKLDAEGAEPDILAALGPRLARARLVLVEFHTPADRRRIDALLPDHELFDLKLHSHRVGVAKYARAGLAG
ncbi:FkbM family methyltransferase [Zavarzinella formosa]|uniref:FkbM family methyltransferase n=1 Tax=Zavarzinella formosa TaxID=360055 RepID=UPI0002EF012A|nr:FkbM family methyltransferase [Zavarzinella formosa]